MSRSECDHLDSYIGGWLTAGQQATFEEHLRYCRVCQAELSRQGRIDDLLARAKTQLEPVPPLLMRRIRRQLEWRGPRRAVHWLPASLSAAAVVLHVMVFAAASTKYARARAPADPAGLAEDIRRVVPEMPAEEARRVARLAAAGR